MLDEARLVVGLSRLHSKPVFKDREWAGCPQPGLKHNEANRAKVRPTKPGSIDPPPAQEVAGNYCQQATHHEDDHAKMQEKDSIGEVTGTW